MRSACGDAAHVTYCNCLMVCGSGPYAISTLFKGWLDERAPMPRCWHITDTATSQRAGCLDVAAAAWCVAHTVYFQSHKAAVHWVRPSGRRMCLTVRSDAASWCCANLWALHYSHYRVASVLHNGTHILLTTCLRGKRQRRPMQRIVHFSGCCMRPHAALSQRREQHSASGRGSAPRSVAACLPNKAAWAYTEKFS